MADLSKPSKYAWYNEGDSLTQPEHARECDMNFVFKRMKTQGIIPTPRQVQYGSEDMNMDRITHEQNKASALENLKMTYAQLKLELNLPNLKYEDFIKSPSKYLKKLEQAPLAEQPPAGTPKALPGTPANAKPTP